MLLHWSCCHNNICYWLVLLYLYVMNGRTHACTVQQPDFVSRFENSSNLEKVKILLGEGSRVNFKAVKTDILGPSYGCLKFAKCTDTHRNHDRSTS